MNQESSLAVVVNTSNAQGKIRAFNSDLKQMEVLGNTATQAVLKIGSTNKLGGLNADIKSTETVLTSLASTSAKTVAAIDKLHASLLKIGTAAQSASSDLTRFSNSNIDAVNRLSAANQGQIRSFSLVNTGLRSNAQFLAQLTTNTAAQTRSITDSIIARDRLRISSAAVAAALSRETTASQNAAAAASRAATAATAEASAQNRLAASAAQVVAAQDRALRSAVELQAARNREATTAAQLAAAETRLAAAAARASASTDRLGQSSRAANAQARGLNGTLSTLQSTIMGSVAGLAGLSVLKTADAMQNLNSQVKLVTNSEREYLLVREKVREIASANYNNIAATTGLYASSARALSNLGKSQADALKFTNAVSLAMRSGGRSASEQASAIMQLGQAMGANVVQGDEFRSLAENAPILLELVAKRLGVLPGQLKKLAADGKVTGEVMYDALTQNVDMLQGLADKASVTMSQAFTVAANKYKAYVDRVMNDTGGMSSTIAGMINNISDNFDVLAKVGLTAVTLGFAGMALSIASASTAMAIFNTVARLNPLVLIASGFLAVNSAIFGTNEVLDISGVIVGDFFDQMSIMIGDAASQWDEFEATVARVMGNNVDVVANANDRNSKNFLGFYEKTEKGFAGVIQGISTGVFSLTNVFMSALTVIDNFITNTNSLLSNLGTGIYNAGQRAKGIFGGEDNSRDYIPYAGKDTNFLTVYKDTFTKGQDSIRDYAKSLNERATPKVKAGTFDPNYVAPLRSNLLKTDFSGAIGGARQGPYANRPAGLPEILRNNQPSTLAISAENLRQKNAFDEIEALKESAAANEKLRKQREKTERAANKGVDKPSKRLVGISGDTGIGKAHLHIQYRDKSRAVSPADLARFQAGGKSIDSYAKTSGFGARNTGIKGASTNHRGTDYGVPKNTPITTTVAVKNVRTWFDKKGGGYVSSIDFEDGVKIDLLHQMPSVEGVDKGASTGNKSVDSLTRKMQSAEDKALEMAIKKQEEMQKLQLKLNGEYGTKEEQLAIDHNKRMEEFRESGFSDSKIAELEKTSKARMDSELAVYREGLNRQLAELSNFQQTKQYLIEQSRKNDIFDAENDKELMRPENSDLLNETKKQINAKYAYEQQQNTIMLQQRTRELFAFERTEREVISDGWDQKILEATNSYDELSLVALAAAKIQQKQELALFDTNQEIKLLDLKKEQMTKIEYINQKYALEKRLIDLSNATPQMKAAETESLDRVAFAESGEVRKNAGNDYEGLVRNLYGQSDASANLDSSWENQREVLRAAYDEGIIQKEEYYSTLEDLDRDYRNKQEAIVVGGYEAAFGAAASVMKAFGADKSFAYRAMFAVEKAFALKRVLLENEVALSKAWSSAAFPYNLPAFGATLLKTGAFTAALDVISPQGFKAGGYTGNYGLDQAVGPVHGQEYVFDAPTTKKIGVNNLDAMSKGKSLGGDINMNINVNVDAKGGTNVQTDNEGLGRRMAQAIKSGVLEVIMQEKEQGGMLHGY